MRACVRVRARLHACLRVSTPRSSRSEIDTLKQGHWGANLQYK